MKAKYPLSRFWAVTQGGVYLVSSQLNNSSCPRVEKISNLLPGHTIPTGSRLGNGNFIGISSIGIHLYFGDPTRQGRQRMEDAGTTYWGGHTSHIVGLFLSRQKALAASKEKNRMIHDPRWRKETLKVLDRIGDDHRIFIPALSRNYNLRKAYEKK